MPFAWPLRIVVLVSVTLFVVLSTYTASADPASPLGLGALAVAPQATPAGAGQSSPASTPVAASPQPAPLPNTTITPKNRLSVTVNQIEDHQFPTNIAYVTATDEGGTPLSGLTTANFELFEDGLPVSNVTVSSTIDTQQPLAVALVLDISGSMQGKPLEYAQQSAISFLDILGPRDSVSLISFSTLVKVNSSFTTTKTYIAQGIANLRAGGDTALYDAVGTAIQSLSQLGPGRKLAVLLTDGEDTKSRTKFEDLSSALGAKRVPVFTVGLGDGVDHAVLDRIAAQSGGRTIFAPSPGDLTLAYRTISDQLRGQYAVTSGSSLKADDKEHKLLVRVKHALGTAEGQGVFVARPNAPWIDVIAPKAGQAITSTTTVEVNAAAASPAARITSVEFEVDGKPLGRSALAPYRALLSASELTSGRHTLSVTARDSAGNAAKQEIDFTALVPIAPTPSPIPTPAPTPIPEAVSEPAPPPPAPPFAAIAGAGVLVAFGGAFTGLVMSRRRRRKPQTCPRCGTFYGYRSACPTCDLAERTWLLHRLNRVTGNPSEDEQKPPF